MNSETGDVWQMARDNQDLFLVDKHLDKFYRFLIKMEGLFIAAGGESGEAVCDAIRNLEQVVPKSFWTYPSDLNDEVVTRLCITDLRANRFEALAQRFSRVSETLTADFVDMGVIAADDVDSTQQYIMNMALRHITGSPRLFLTDAQDPDPWLVALSAMIGNFAGVFKSQLFNGYVEALSIICAPDLAARGGTVLDGALQTLEVSECKAALPITTTWVGDEVKCRAAKFITMHDLDQLKSPQLDEIQSALLQLANVESVAHDGISSYVESIVDIKVKSATLRATVSERFISTHADIFSRVARADAEVVPKLNVRLRSLFLQGLTDALSGEHGEPVRFAKHFLFTCGACALRPAGELRLDTLACAMTDADVLKKFNLDVDGRLCIITALEVVSLWVSRRWSRIWFSRISDDALDCFYLCFW